jgi:hypothetical protein
MRKNRVIAAAALILVPFIAGVTSANATSALPVSIRIVLNVTTITPGHDIHGSAILTNASSKSIQVSTWECDQWLFVGLANRHVSYDPAVPTAACTQNFELKPGANRVAITVSTKYQVCAGAGAPSPGGPPRCTRSGMPSLPKGKYHIVVLTNGFPKVAQYSSRLRVTIT